MSIAGAVRIICAQALLLLGLASPGLAEPTAASTPSEDNEACAWISSRQDFSSPLPRPGWGDLVALSGRPDGSRLWAVGGKGRIVGLTGGRVQEEESGSDVDLYAVWAGSADEAWAVGARGTLLHRQDGAWRPVPSGTGRCLFAVWGRNPRDLWVGGNDGLVLHGDGSAWRRTPTGSQGPITQLIDCGRGRVCALDLAGTLPNVDTSDRPCRDPNGDCLLDEPAEPEGDRILRWSGRRWGSPLWMGAFPRHLAWSGDRLWALAENGLIVRKGKTETATPLTADFDQVRTHGLWMDSHGEGWVVGRRCRQGQQAPVCDRGAIWRVGGGKATLLPLDPAPSPLYAVWGWPGGAVVVGEQSTVMVFDGNTWKSAR